MLSRFVTIKSLTGNACKKDSNVNKVDRSILKGYVNRNKYLLHVSYFAPLLTKILMIYITVSPPTKTERAATVTEKVEVYYYYYYYYK